MFGSSNNMGGGFQEEGSGFMNSQSQFASPNQGQPKKDSRLERLTPLTIKTILDQSGETVLLHGVEVKMMVIVGFIKSMEVASTKCTFVIDDCTGCIECVKWIENRDPEEMNDKYKDLRPMTYCRIVGNQKIQGNKKIIMILNIQKLESYNMVTSHILEVIHTDIKMAQVNKMLSAPSQGPLASQGQMAPPSHNSSSMNDGGMGLSGINKNVFDLVKMSFGEQGVHKDVINQHLSTKFSSQAINKALDFLMGEGHIYSTIDDDHFQTTDS